MATNKLTPLQIKALKPKTKNYRVADGDGLYLEIHPSGRMYWRLAYRYGGKQKTLAIGVHGDVTLSAARAKRAEARKLLADGADPGEHKKLVKQRHTEQGENTFEAVALLWFSLESTNWAASNSTRILRRLETHVFPWLGNRPIAELKRPEILQAVRRIEANGTIETAHRCLNYIGKIVRYAISEGIMDGGDPTSKLVPERKPAPARISIHR